MALLGGIGNDAAKTAAGAVHEASEAIEQIGQNVEQSATVVGGSLAQAAGALATAIGGFIPLGLEELRKVKLVVTVSVTLEDK